MSGRLSEYGGYGGNQWAPTQQATAANPFGFGTAPPQPTFGSQAFGAQAPSQSQQSLFGLGTAPPQQTQSSAFGFAPQLQSQQPQQSSAFGFVPQLQSQQPQQSSAFGFAPQSQSQLNQRASQMAALLNRGGVDPFNPSNTAAPPQFGQGLLGQVAQPPQAQATTASGYYGDQAFDARQRQWAQELREQRALNRPGPREEEIELRDRATREAALELGVPGAGDIRWRDVEDECRRGLAELAVEGSDGNLGKKLTNDDIRKACAFRGPPRPRWPELSKATRLSDDLKRQLDDARQRLEVAQREVREYKEFPITVRAEKQIQGLTKENADLRNQLAARTTEFEDAKAEVAIREQTLGLLDEELEKTRAELQPYKTAYEEQWAQLQQLQPQLQRTQAEVVSLNQQIQELKKQVTEAQQRAQVAGTVSNEKVEDLRKQWQQQTDAEKQRFNQELAEANAASEQLRKQLKEAQEAKEAALKAAENLIGLQGKLADAEKSKTEAEEEARRLSRELETAKNARNDNQKTIELLQKDLRNKEAERKDAADGLIAANNKLAEQRTQLDENVKETQRIRVELEEAKRALEASRALVAQEGTEAQQSLQRLQAKINEFETQVNKKDDEIKTLKQKQEWLGTLATSAVVRAQSEIDMQAETQATLKGIENLADEVGTVIEQINKGLVVKR